MSTEKLTELNLDNLRALRHRGFAVVIFYPEELNGADPRRVEDRLCELGNDVIHDLASEDE